MLHGYMLLDILSFIYWRYGDLYVNHDTFGILICYCKAKSVHNYNEMIAKKPELAVNSPQTLQPPLVAMPQPLEVQNINENLPGSLDNH